LIVKYSNAFLAYKELIKTGGIRCTTESENLLLDLRGNLAGDILVFIGPKNNTIAAVADTWELIRSDRTLALHREAVFESLRQKYRGLSLLPNNLAWGLNSIIAALYAYINSGRILGLCEGEINPAEILSVLPLVLMPVITPIIARTFGFRIIKPFISFITWFIKSFRKISGRKVS
jgi:hypothetical protein